MELLQQLVDDSKNKPQQHQKQLDHYNPTLNCYNFFCHFCLNNTIWENKGNFSKCQGCSIIGSNYEAACANCQKKTFIFGDKCVNCVGAYKHTDQTVT